MGEVKIDADDFLAVIASGIEERDHRIVVVDAEAGLTAEIEAQMEADGYTFGYAPPADDGKRKFYFIRRPDPSMTM